MKDKIGGVVMFIKTLVILLVIVNLIPVLERSIKLKKYKWLLIQSGFSFLYIMLYFSEIRAISIIPLIFMIVIFFYHISLLDNLSEELEEKYLIKGKVEINKLKKLDEINMITDKEKEKLELLESMLQHKYYKGIHKLLNRELDYEIY